METYEKDVMELLRKYEEEADGIDPMDWLYDEWKREGTSVPSLFSWDTKYPSRLLA